MLIIWDLTQLLNKIYSNYNITNVLHYIKIKVQN